MALWRHCASPFLHGLYRSKHEVTNMIEGALTQRGWTLQEITLSPRVLWFGAWEMAWRCACTTACECQPELIRKLANVPDSYKRWEVPKVTMGEQEDEEAGVTAVDSDDVEVGYGLEEVMKRADAVQVCLAMWHEILPLYTKRDLTNPGDRLPAVAGLAGILMRRLSCRYLCGLWEVDLRRQLLWSIVTMYDQSGIEKGVSPTLYRDPRIVRLPENYAPSWSWGSVSGMVSFIGTTRRPGFEFWWEIKNVWYEPSGDNLYGPGKGRLQITSKIIPLRPEDGFLACNPVIQHKPPRQWPVRFCRLEGSCVLDVRIPEVTKESLAGKRLFCIIAGVLHTGSSPHERKPWLMVGLLLEQDCEDPNVYRRLGLIQTQVDSEENEWAIIRREFREETVILV